MILLIQTDASYEADFRGMLQAFFPTVRIQAMSAEEAGKLRTKMFREMDFCFTALFRERAVVLRIEERGYVRFSAYCPGDYRNRGGFRNRLKLASYRILSEFTGRSLPWGSLTGMRPTKIATKLLAEGRTGDEIQTYYEKNYGTSPKKAELAAEVAAVEQPILEAADPEKDYCLYIHIPFCPTRCLYCSFAAYPVMEYEDRILNYLYALKKELQYISYLNRGRRLVSIYIGGGTPTALSESQLGDLLDAVNGSFDTENLTEYTVEAGRPDSITREKLKILKKHGVTRISINPQTMNAETLRIIGRAHTPADIVRAFRDARGTGFQDINMDIIAGLPKETAESMRYTLGELEKLAPDSLTVHTLCLKRTASLNLQLDQYRDTLPEDPAAMVEMAQARARRWGLHPYYLYRQRNMEGNLENTGFTRPGLECRYNILIMEERTDVFAAGAGAITRLVFYDPVRHQNRKTLRVENVRNLEEYIERIDEMNDRLREAVEARRMAAFRRKEEENGTRKEEST